MLKETLQRQQPTVYQILKNALEHNQLSHCYLFVGPKGTPKKETALLLAQSLVCERQEGLACQQCASCQRIIDGNYADLVCIDGDGKPIRIETIEALQNKFEKTALEKAGKKIFIIDNCETLTLKSANSLLKFIEEPSANVTGIFIASQPDRLLPTIVSRCQTVSFRPLSKDEFYEQARSQGIDELNSHFLAQLVNNAQQLTTLNDSPAYRSALISFMEFMPDFFASRPESVLYLQQTFSRFNRTDRNSARDIFRYFLEIALQFVSDYLDDYQSEDETYASLLASARSHEFDYTRFLKAVAQSRDGLNKAANGLLLMDQMLYNLMEV